MCGGAKGPVASPAQVPVVPFAVADHMVRLGPGTVPGAPWGSASGLGRRVRAAADADHSPSAVLFLILKQKRNICEKRCSVHSYIKYCILDEGTLG